MDSCRDITEQVTDHLEGQQSWSEWVRFRFHILMCPACRAYLRQMEATVETLAAMPGEPLPDQVRDGLLERYRAWQEDQTQDRD